MVLGNTLNILRPPDRSTPPIQTGWNEDLVKNMHKVLGELAQQITSQTFGGLPEGTSRPAFVKANVFWLDITSATVPIVKLFDGTDDITVMTFNYSANTVTFNGLINLSTATVTGTFAQFNTALSDETFTALGKIGGFNAQTANYTAVLTDIGKVITMNNASARTITIPTNASVAFAVGSWFSVIEIGAGTLTITGDTGVTVNGVSAGGADAPFRYAFITCLKVATDTWYMDLNGVA